MCAHLVPVVVRPTVELGVRNGTGIRLVKLDKPRNVRDEWIIVMAARHYDSVKLIPGRLVGLEIKHLDLPPRLGQICPGLLLDAQDLGLIRDVRGDVLGVLLEILEHGAVPGKQRRALGELLVRVVHERVGDVGLEQVVDGRHELDLAAVPGPEGLVGEAAGPRSRDREAILAGEGRVVPDTAWSGTLFKDVNLGEFLLCEEVSGWRVVSSRDS